METRLKNALKNSRQSDAKPKPITTWSHAFSRAWRRLRVLALSSPHWFIVLAIVIALVWFSQQSIEDCSIYVLRCLN